MFILDPVLACHDTSVSKREWSLYLDMIIIVSFGAIDFSHGHDFVHLLRVYNDIFIVGVDLFHSQTIRAVLGNSETGTLLSSPSGLVALSCIFYYKLSHIIKVSDLVIHEFKKLCLNFSTRFGTCCLNH